MLRSFTVKLATLALKVLTGHQLSAKQSVCLLGANSPAW